MHVTSQAGSRDHFVKLHNGHYENKIIFWRPLLTPYSSVTFQASTCYCYENSIVIETISVSTMCSLIKIHECIGKASKTAANQDRVTVISSTLVLFWPSLNAGLSKLYHTRLTHFHFSISLKVCCLDF